mmetsp:Transcript_34811/g.112182  ORF Transcript_34811/g.112182 Transcript_34811/m.112182 type:complete len:346 (+) Transcript_34811:861-1898(+)
MRQVSHWIIIAASSLSLSNTREQMPQKRPSSPPGAHAAHHTPSSLQPRPVRAPQPSQQRQSEQITSPSAPPGSAPLLLAPLRGSTLSQRAQRVMPAGRLRGASLGSSPGLAGAMVSKRQRGHDQWSIVSSFGSGHGAGVQYEWYVSAHHVQRSSAESHSHGESGSQRPPQTKQAEEAEASSPPPSKVIAATWCHGLSSSGGASSLPTATSSLSGLDASAFAAGPPSPSPAPARSALSHGKVTSMTFSLSLSSRRATMWIFSFGRWKAFALEQMSRKSSRKARTASSWVVPYWREVTLPRMVRKSIGLSTTVWYCVASAYSTVTGSAKKRSRSSFCSWSSACAISV